MEEFIISTYCFVDNFLKTQFFHPIRSRGEAPALSDAEVITMEIVGEYMGHGSDKAIWSYFKTHWFQWFPALGCRTSFTRQTANLINVKDKLLQTISSPLSANQDLYLCDGFPIPICHIKRYKRSKSALRCEGAPGYCAAKEEHYFGFKGHLVVTQHGSMVAFDIAPANVDERDILPEITAHITGMLLADKGLIRPALKEELAARQVDLQTPLRRNMRDPRPKETLSFMMNLRRRIETVIGQLVERFHIQSIRAKDLWHLCVKVERKILAHTFCFMLNQIKNPDQPLALELLVA